MPKFHGIPFVWRTANQLRRGDVVLLDWGAHVEREVVSAIYHDPDGTWLDLADATGTVVDCGYATGRYRVSTD